MTALVESPPLRSQTSSPVHSVQGSTATFGHGRVSFDLHTPPSMLKQQLQQQQGANSDQPTVSTNNNNTNPITSGMTTTTIPEVNVNGAAVISPNRPQKPAVNTAVSASSSTGSGGGAGPSAGAKETEGWGANFWVTLIEPQSQTPFYACPSTGQVSWDPPVGNFVLPPSTEGEWWELVDESRGLPYYYHTKTNETVWERPDGFVIPLGILQNTALCRRLSARYSQVFDENTSVIGQHLQQQNDATTRHSVVVTEAKSGTRSRRSSQHSVQDVQARRQSQSSIRVNGRSTSQGSGPSGNVNTSNNNSGRRSVSDGAHQHRHMSGMYSNLPPIPASPYATEESTPPSPSSRAAGGKVGKGDVVKGKGKQREGVDENQQQQPLPQETTIPRARSKSTSSAVAGGVNGNATPVPVPYRAPIPQSLDAAAELLANTGAEAKDSGTGNTVNATGSPHRKFSASSASAYSQTTGGGPVSVSFPTPVPIPSTTNDTSPIPNPNIARVFFTPQETSTPPRLSVNPSSGPTLGSGPGSSVVVGNGKTDEPVTPLRTGFGGLMRRRSKSRDRGGEKDRDRERERERMPPPSPRRPIPPPPPNGGLWMGGAGGGGGTPQIRTRDISEPKLDAEATMNLSPIKARAGGKPILVGPKTPQTISSGDGPTRFSTGGRPVLPDDLASDIQQFVQTEFARQYFSTHRTGFIFRRKVPVERMMMWQKTPVSSPLLMLNRSLHKDAVKIFKVIQRIMGDRERDKPVGVSVSVGSLRSQASEGHLTSLASSASSLNASSTSLPSLATGILEEERWLLTEGLAHGELRDEIYCQLVKQLTGNPNPESLFRGWQLMCVLLVTFPPSKNFEAYLRSFMQHRTAQTEGRVDIMAKYCLQRLSVIAKKGPRGKAPTVAEIETASDAAFNPSTFGETIDAVIRLQERTYPHLKVPIILPFLADGILALGGTKSEGIFRIPGDGDVVSELKIRIERGYYNLEGVDDPHVPASLLKLWLRELCDPLVPTELYNECVEHARDPDACVGMVSRLPTYNRRVLLFVVSFLQLFLDDKVQNVTKMTAPNLALVMAPNLLRCDSDSMAVVFTNAPYEQSFVLNLLLHLKCSKVDQDYVPKHGLGSAVASPAMSMPKGSKSRGRRIPR